jgi:hypothetical protein
VILRTAPRSRQRGFIINPYRYGSGSGGSNPAPSTDTDFPSVTLSLHGAGANNATTQADTSRYGRGLNRIGDAKISTAQARFASVGSSMFFDGADDAWTTDASALWVAGSDFTISGSCYLTSLPASGNATLISNFSDAGRRGIGLEVLPNGSMSFRWSTDGTETAGTLSSPTSLVAANTWVDWEVCRSGGTIYLFVNGALADSDSIIGAVFSPRTPTNIGRTPDTTPTWFVTGYQAELRVTIGAAKHTSGFTPYTTPYADTGGTLTTIYETWGVVLNMTKSSSDTVVSESTSSDIGANGLFSVDHDWYCEITCTASGTFDAAVGIRRNDSDTTVNFATGLVCSVRASGSTFAGSTGATAGTATSYSSGDVIQLAWKRSEGKLFVGKNGTWMNSGNPAAGTGAMFTGVPGDGWLPYVGGDNGTGNHTFTANFGATAFTYSVPSGFAAITA